MNACQRCGSALASDGRCYWCELAQAVGILRMPPPPMLGPEREPAPDPDPAHLTAKVLGFRGWHLDGYKLASGVGEWTIGVNTAECKRDLFEGLGLPPFPSPVHEAPDHHCTCGLYAWYEPMALLPGFVNGAVLAWGRIEAQPTGFRAQYAEPVVLAYHDEQPYKLVVDLKAIAGEMGLECVPLEELEAEAAKHGKPIPEELRPSYSDPGLAIPPGALSPFIGAFASGGVVTRPLVLPPEPEPPKPTWGARVPLMIVALAVPLEIAAGAILGTWWIQGPVAAWCAAMFLIGLRSYRQRYRRPT